ncbi:MAG TPA: OB-fold nucleic acid binding domain-containing protein [Candidatus Angelobacter sp.]|nr:OB-fold nucleic acid binding domain-containing protein [Candidatus Angelobacter sp.]
MKDFYIAEAARFENQVITSAFVVVSKQAKPKKSGELYLALTLADRTGYIEAKMWDNVADHINCFEQDDFIKVRGLINKFNGRFQLTLHKIRSLEEAEIQFDDFLPRTTKNVEEMWGRLADFVESFRDPHLKALIRAFMADAQIAEAYKAAPAAKSLHHAFIGGLLEHVLSLFQACDLTSRNYPDIIDRDLLLAGAFLHDIGKLHELTFARSFAYTTRGQLLGHMIIELEMLHEKLEHLPDFPAEYKTLLEHMIISHHGKYEFGSPKLPMFPEALMLHYLDDLDSKIEGMRAHFAREPGAEWTGYNPNLERPLLNSRRYLERARAPQPEPAADGSPTEPASAAAAAAATDDSKNGRP